ncbi:MAG: hypothetical protein WC248_02795 [Candidatus Methanomethylophilaceae archaeon]
MKYRVCEGGMLRMGAVLATDYNKACGIALKSYPIVVDVMDGPKMYGHIIDTRRADLGLMIWEEPGGFR